MKSKVIVTFLVGALLMSGTVFADQNLVDTLPKVDTFNKPSEIKLTIEKSSEQEEAVKKMLATKIRPAAFGIKGVKSLPFKEVSAFFSPYVNKEITIGKLVEITQQVTAHYREKGYPLSFCYVPNQDYTAQDLLIAVIEGYIENINIEGNPGEAEVKMREIGEHLLQEKPLTQKTMERYVSMMSQLPGLNVQADLQLPKKVDGGTDLTLKVKRRPIDAYGRLEAVDTFTRVNLTAKEVAFTPLAEQITFSTLLSKNDEEYFGGTYTQMIGNDGFMMKLDGSAYDGNQAGAFGPGVGRQVSSSRFGIDFSYPFELTLTKLISANVSFYTSKFTDATRLDTRLSSQIDANRDGIADDANGDGIPDTVRYPVTVASNSETDVRAFSWGASYSERLASQIRAGNIIMTKGIDGLGSSKTADQTTIINGILCPKSLCRQTISNPYDVDFFKLNAIVNQKDFFWGGLLGTSLTVSGQYSGDRLPVTERILYGGYNFARAYRPGKIAGDSGIGASFEINSLIPFGYSLPLYHLKGFQPYILFENAWVNSKDNINQGNDHLISGSLGLRVLNADSQSLNVDFSISQGIKGAGSRNFFDNLNFGVNFGVPN